MPDLEIYTVANGLKVGPRAFETVNASFTYCYVLTVDIGPPAIKSQRRLGPSKVQNTLYELRINDDKTGIRSNTDSKLFPSTWHLSIGKDGKPLDPWTVWEQAGFEASGIEIITGKQGAKPWLLSFRRRDATVIQEEKAAVDNYNRRFEIAQQLMQLSSPRALPTPKSQIPASARRRSCDKGSTDTSSPRKRRISSAGSLASSSSSHSSIGKTDKAPKTLVRVSSVASTATGQTSVRNVMKKGWRNGFRKR
jgi:hypothetical protein